MIRKLLVVVAAIAIPVSTLTALGAVVDTGVAGAKTPVITTISCALSGNIAFAPAPVGGTGLGGLSVNGNFGATAKSDTDVSTITAAGTGCQTTPNVTNITNKTTKCAVPVTPATATIDGIPANAPFTNPPGCVAAEIPPKNKLKGYYYGLAWDYATGASSSLATALRKGIHVTDNGVALTLLVTPTSVTTVLPGAGNACGPSDAGFQVSGNIKKEATGAGAPNYTFLVCLAGDSGPATSGSFVTDVATMALAPNSNLGTAIETATITPTYSSLNINAT
jgi:hypothetical protein